MNVKMYKGKKPRTDGWEHIGDIEQDGRWLVFVRQNADIDWLTAKVVADGRAQGKANYWLGWNGKRFAQQTDAFAMVQGRPELMHKVEQMLEGYALI
jgi:hypothetical protein